MQKSLVRKGLVVGIIGLFIVLSVSQSCLAMANPDFEIVDVKLKYTDWGWPYFLIDIMNHNVSYLWKGRCQVSFKKLFSDETVYSKMFHWGYNQMHWSWKVKTLRTWEIDMEYMPKYMVGRIFFEVDPNNQINETNEDNNVVWAYCFYYWFQFVPDTIAVNMFIGRLRR